MNSIVPVSATSPFTSIRRNSQDAASRLVTWWTRVLYPVVTGPERVSSFAAEDGDGGVEHPHHGGRALFGLGQARSLIAREATALVVSGYPTVVAYHRVGLTNTVAPCGPHMTAD